MSNSVLLPNLSMTSIIKTVVHRFVTIAHPQCSQRNVGALEDRGTATQDGAVASELLEPLQHVGDNNPAGSQNARMNENQTPNTTQPAATNPPQPKPQNPRNEQPNRRNVQECHSAQSMCNPTEKERARKRKKERKKGRKKERNQGRKGELKKRKSDRARARVPESE